MNKNIYICSSIYIYRFFILRKKPTLLKLAAAGIVCVGLIMSLIPVIGNMDKDSAAGLWHQQSAAGRILWPLCFMIGFVSYIHDHMLCMHYLGGLHGNLHKLCHCYHYSG